MSSAQSESRLACLVCRQRKVACDRQRPRCSLCTKNDFECQYRPRQHQPGLRAGYVSQLEKQLKSVEERLRKVEARLDHNDQMSSGANQYTPAGQAPSPFSAGVPPVAEQDVSSEGLFQSPEDSGMSVTELQGMASQNSPTAATVTKGVETWYQKYRPWFPILHEASFESIGDPTTSRHRLVREALTAVIIFDSKDSTSYEQQLAENLRRNVMLEGPCHSSLQNIQALLIISIHYFGAGHMTQFWNIMAVCRRMSILLDLPVMAAVTSWPCVSKSRQLESPIEQEEGIRAFWMIEMLDNMSTLGLPCCFTPFEVIPSARLPCSESIWALPEPVIMQSASEERQYLSGFSLCIILGIEELGVVQRFLKQSFNFSNLERRLDWQSEAQRLDERLTNWREEFVAAVFRLINVEKAHLPRGEMEPFITLANCVLNTAVIVLMQKMAPVPKGIESDHESWAFASSRCVYACENMAAKVRRIAGDQLDAQSPQLIFCIFVAARFYLVNSKALDADVPANLHSLAFYLHSCGKTRPLAQKFETIIRTAVAEHRSPISECVLPVEFYDLRYSTIQIVDLLQAAAERLGQVGHTPTTMAQGRRAPFETGP